MRKFNWTLVLGISLLAGLGLEAQAVGPSADLDPPAVVQAQLDGLKRDDESGFALVFSFASPGNRVLTGPLQRFTQMLRSGYGEMLGHREAAIGTVVIEGDQALVPVRLTARDGRRFTYLFVLGRQSEPPCLDCWMTDSVISQNEAEGLAI